MHKGKQGLKTRQENRRFSGFKALLGESHRNLRQCTKIKKLRKINTLRKLLEDLVQSLL